MMATVVYAPVPISWPAICTDALPSAVSATRAAAGPKLLG
jgi:hypothetical protein